MRQAPARLRGDLSRAAHIAVAATFALSSLGCASGPPLITSLPPIEPEKPPTGRVVLVMSGANPSAQLQKPGVMGPGEGAAAGAALGATVPPMIGMGILASSRGSITGLFFGLAAFGAGIVAAPVGAGVGAAVGALAAPSREEANQNAGILQRAFAEMRLGEELAAEILAVGGAYPILLPIVEHQDSTMPAVDTFLEIDAPRVSLTSNDVTEWRPELRLRVAVDATLVRASDREELAHWTWTHESQKARLGDWSRDDARLFRVELEHAIRAVAERAVSDFVPGPVQTPPDDDGHRATSDPPVREEAAPNL